MADGLTVQKCSAGEVWTTTDNGEVLVLSTGMEKKGDVLVLALIRNNSPYHPSLRRSNLFQRWEAQKLDTQFSEDSPKFIYAFPENLKRITTMQLQNHVWNIPYPEFFSFQEKIVKWLFGPDAMLTTYHGVPNVTELSEEELKVLGHRRWTKAKRELAAVMWDRFNHDKTMERLFGCSVDLIKEKILIDHPEFDFSFDYPIEPENE